MYNFILYLEKRTVFTPQLAMARMLFALGSIGMLIFTDISVAINFDLLPAQSANIEKLYFFRGISLFKLFGAAGGKAICIIFLLFSISGFLPQLSSILQAWAHISICNSIIVIEGGDQIAANLSLLLIPVCLFDPRLNQWTDI